MQEGPRLPRAREHPERLDGGAGRRLLQGDRGAGAPRVPERGLRPDRGRGRRADQGLRDDERGREPCHLPARRQEQLQVFDELDERGWDLWAIYHSHTHTEAYPSETDRKLAFYPGLRYLLLSVADRDEPVIRSFFIRDGEVTEEELTIT